MDVLCMAFVEPTLARGTPCKIIKAQLAVSLKGKRPLVSRTSAIKTELQIVLHLNARSWTWVGEETALIERQKSKAPGEGSWFHRSARTLTLF